MEKVTRGEVHGPDLQQLFDKLRHLTEALETGDLSLEDSIKTYEEAVQVQNEIRAVLNDADRKVVELAKAKGKPEPFGYTDE